MVKGKCLIANFSLVRTQREGTEVNMEVEMEERLVSDVLVTGE
jgi:hypothetical protein